MLAEVLCGVAHTGGPDSSSTPLGPHQRQPPQAIVEQDPSPQIGLSPDEAGPEVTEPILLEPLLETFLHCDTPPAVRGENSVLHAHSAGLCDDPSAHPGAGGSVAPARAE